MARRWILLAAVLVAGSACRPTTYTRSQIRERWVSTYVNRWDITRPQAECIVDRFFGETSDEELRPLSKGRDLTDGQVARIGELAVACGVGPGSNGTPAGATGV